MFKAETKTNYGREYVVISEGAWVKCVVTTMWDNKTEQDIKVRIFRKNPGKCECPKGGNCSHVKMLSQVVSKRGWMN